MTQAGGDIPPVTGPLPVVSGRRGFRVTFASFGAFNFRLFFASTLLGSVGAWMARIAIDWLVFELTGDLTLVGLTTALQFLPLLVLAPIGGVLSDRHSRRRTLLITTSLSATSITSLAVLVMTGYVELWHVYVAATVTGVFGAMAAPSTSAFVSDVVGAHRLPNAISLNATTQHLGGFIGPAIAGLLIAAFGSGPCIAINAATLAFSVLMLSLMRPRELVPAHRQPRARRQIRSAVAYVAGKPTILWTLALLAFMSVFAMQLPVLLTAAASPGGYDTGSAGYGLLSSIAAVGAFTGAILSATRTSLSLRSLVATTLLYSVITVFCGLAPHLGFFVGAIALVGIARVTFVVTADAMTQLSTNPGIRGRVMSFFLLIVAAGQVIGGPLLGWIAQHASVSTAFVVAGAIPGAFAVVAGITLAVRRKLRVRVDLRRPRRLIQVYRQSELG